MTTVRTVHPVTEARDFLYPWMPEFTFALQELSAEERGIIPAIAGVEATFENSTEQFDRFVRFLLLGSEGWCLYPFGRTDSTWPGER